MRCADLSMLMRIAPSAGNTAAASAASNKDARRTLRIENTLKGRLVTALTKILCGFCSIANATGSRGLTKRSVRSQRAFHRRAQHQPALDRGKVGARVR